MRTLTPHPDTQETHTVKSKTNNSHKEKYSIPTNNEIARVESNKLSIHKERGSHNTNLVINEARELN